METEIQILRRIRHNYNQKLRQIMNDGKVIAASGNQNIWALLTHDGYKELIDEFGDMAVMPLGKDCGLFQDEKGCIGFCNWAFFLRERKGIFYLGNYEVKLPADFKSIQCGEKP